jgi:hypothetical protein
MPRIKILSGNAFQRYRTVDLADYLVAQEAPQSSAKTPEAARSSAKAPMSPDAAAGD